MSGAKGILAVEGQRGLIVAAGNPTTRDGALYYLVQRGDALPDMQCACGRVLQPKRSGILDAKGRAV